MEPKTYEEMLETARTLFGENATVEWGDESGWTVHTGIREKFDREEFKGTPAYDADDEYESEYGSTLARWTWKSMLGDLTARETYIAYNQRMLLEEIRLVYMTMQTHLVAPGFFKTYGDFKLRDDCLKYAEEHGIKMEDIDPDAYYLGMNFNLNTRKPV